MGCGKLGAKRSRLFGVVCFFSSDRKKKRSSIVPADEVLPNWYNLIQICGD